MSDISVAQQLDSALRDIRERRTEGSLSWPDFQALLALVYCVRKCLGFGHAEAAGLVATALNELLARAAKRDAGGER